MRRANAQLQSDRRAEILDAAERCFARAGFHQASMQDICAEAGMSPGNLYRYFPSKEALIAGIAERNRAEAAQRISPRSTRRRTSSTGFAALARQYLVERSDAEVALCAEIMAESRRNPEIARIYQDIDTRHRTRLRRACSQPRAERGEIRRRHRLRALVTVLMVLGDGMSWRRAVEPSFYAESRHAAGAAIWSIRLLDRCAPRHVARPGSSPNESEPHHRRRPRRRRRALDRLRPLVAARQREEPGRDPSGASEGAADCSASSVAQAQVVAHAASSLLSGRTEADHKVMHRRRAPAACSPSSTSRAAQHVKKDDVIAVLSDEAREAQVAQAQALC